MPRPPRAPRSVIASTNSLVAAGTNMRAVALTPSQTPATKYSQPWQAMAWHYYDTIGELRYAATYFSKVLSRSRLYAATRKGRDFTEEKDGPIFDVVSAFFGGPEGQSQALAQIGLHLFVAGECYVVGRARRTERGEKGSGTVWEVVGCEEIQVVGSDWSINYGDNKPALKLRPSDDVIRIWYPHPKMRILADSPVHAVLGILAEIERLSQHIHAQIISRLTGSGLLLLPQGMTFPSPPPEVPLPEDPTDADKVMATLYTAMVTAVQRPDDASAVAPIVMLVPDDFVDKANLLKFWSELDNHAMEMRGDNIKRLAVGIDLPAEVLNGTADLNHWSTWQIDESAIKAHFEPALELIVEALSSGYATEASGTDDGVIRYDTSVLRLRPNRSKEAIELWDRGQLNDDALRRETGFGPDDVPTNEQKKQWLLSQVVSNSSATPEMMAAAADQLGVDLGSGVPETIRISENPDTVKESRPDPSLRDHPVQDPNPDEADLAAAIQIGVVRAAEGLALRALERAGNRLRATTAQRPACTAVEVHTFIPAKPADLDRLLSGAWDHLPLVMRGLPFDQQAAIEAGLDSYVRAVLVGQKGHDLELMKHHLTHSPVRALA